MDQQFERDDLEGGLVGGFEDDGAGGSGLLDLEPAGGADTPAVAGSEAGESVLRHGCAEIVAKGLGDAEELFIDDAADGVDTEVVGACVATVVAVEAGRRILRLAAADVQRLAEDVATAGFDGFGDRHVGFYQYLPLVSGLETAEDVLEAVGGPEEFFLLYDEGWGEADDVVVRLFCEDTFAHEGFADGAGWGGQFNGDPETSATDFYDVRAVDLAEAVATLLESGHFAQRVRS